MCIHLNVIKDTQDTRWGSETPLQRCSLCIHCHWRNVCIHLNVIKDTQVTRWRSLPPPQRCSHSIHCHWGNLPKALAQCKTQPLCPGYELRTLIRFPIKMTVMVSAFPGCRSKTLTRKNLIATEIRLSLALFVLHSYIHEYGHVRNGWNGHRMLVTYIHRTYKEHRNLEIRKHVTTSCSGTKPFY